MTGLGQRGDRVAKEVRAGVRGALVEQLGQVSPGDLDLAGAELPWNHGDLAAGGVDDDAVSSSPGLQSPDVLQDAHPAQHGAVGLALEVDGLAAAPDLGGLLHHRDLEAVTVEPVGQRGSGDAGTGDEHTGVLHADDAPGPYRQNTDRASTAHRQAVWSEHSGHEIPDPGSPVRVRG